MIEVTLEKIDMIKERTKVSYKEAKEALEKCNGNIVDALIYIENEKRKKKEELYITKEELVTWIKGLVKKGNINRIKITKNNKVIADIPVTAAIAVTAISFLAYPFITVGVFTAALTKVSIEITKTDGTVEVINKIVKNTVDNIKDKVNTTAFQLKDKISLNKNSGISYDDDMCSYTVNFHDENKDK